VARKKGDRPIETENVTSPGEGRHEMSVRNSVIGTFVDNLQRLRNGRALLALIDEQERS
jgi:hypothetical protein